MVEDGFYVVLFVCVLVSLVYVVCGVGVVGEVVIDIEFGSVVFDV